MQENRQYIYWVVTILITVIAVSLVGVAVWYERSKVANDNMAELNNTNGNVDIQNSVNSVGSDAEFDVSQWDTYKNDKYSFSISYPSDSAVDESAEIMPIIKLPVDDCQIRFNMEGLGWGEFSVVLPVQEVIMEDTKLNKSRYAYEESNLVQLEIIRLSNNISAIELFYPNTLKHGKCENMFSLMLSTYKSIAPPGDWQKYSSRDGSFSFLYPSDWEVSETSDLNFFIMKDTQRNQEYQKSAILVHYPGWRDGMPEGGGSLIVQQLEITGEQFVNLYNTDDDSASQITKPITVSMLGHIQFDHIVAATAIGLDSNFLITKEKLKTPLVIKYDNFDPIQKEILNTFNFTKPITDLEDASGAVDQIPEKNFYVAQKEDTVVTVNRVNIATGEKNTLFSYNERASADAESGNLWEGMPPSIALSHSGTKIAYASQEGVFVFDLQKNTSSKIVKYTSLPLPDTELPPSWEQQELKGFYSFTAPVWSADDGYISVLGSMYEGAQHIFFHVSDQKIIIPKGSDDNILGAWFNLTWSPTKIQYVKPNTKGYQTPGLFVGTETSLDKPVDRSLQVYPEGEYYGVNFSKTGDQIIGLYKETENSKDFVVYHHDLTSRKTRIIAKVVNELTPFFSADTRFVYYFFGTKDITLVKYSLNENKIIEQLQLPQEFDRWEFNGYTKDGYAILTAGKDLWPGRRASDQNKLFVFDTQKSAMIYMSEQFNGFTTFLGFGE